MSEQPPDFLPYESRSDPSHPNSRTDNRTESGWLPVFVGLLGGAALSGTVWPLIFFENASFGWFIAALFSMLALKLVGSGILMSRRSRARYIGIGLLLSLGLGGLIFFCVCGASFSAALHH